MLELLGLEQGTLTNEQLQQLKQPASGNADVFALNESELGYTTVVEHHVDTGDHAPSNNPSSGFHLCIGMSLLVW